MIPEKKGGSVNWDPANPVEVIDDYHVKVNYAKWTNWAIGDFTYTGNMYMVSPAAYEKYGPEEIGNHMVGTGPFVQTDFEQDVQIKFDANKSYWQTGKPYVDKLVALCVEDPVTAQTTILSGGADILVTEADQKVPDLKSKGLSAVTRSVGVMNMFLDTANPDSVFANQANREALEYAMDKATICANIFGGLMTPAYQMAPPNVPSYVPSIAGRKFDVAKAKALMAEAGNPNGFTFTFYPIPVPLFEIPAQAIQANLTSIGINADYQTITNTKFGEIVVGDWEGAVFAAVSSCIPNWVQALSGFFSPTSILYKPMLRSEAFTAAYNAAAFTKDYDNAKAQALIQEMYDEQMTIPCFYSGEAYVYQPYVNGAWDLWPAGLQMWGPENTWLDK